MVAKPPFHFLTVNDKRIVDGLEHWWISRTTTRMKTNNRKDDRQS
jgi:hypothetical protein